MKKVKYLIAGGGISGLSFALTKQDEDYLILEKSNRLGGLCQSFYEQGFVWDVAGHFFHFHSQDTRRFYEELMREKEQRTVVKRAKVHYNGKDIDAPFQYNIHQLPTNEFLECLTDLYYVQDRRDYGSFEEYVRGKYGTGISNKFLIPYNEKLYACKMNDLEQDSMGEFLPELDFEVLMKFYRGLREKTYNDTFRYPVKGCMEFINSLALRLDSNRIRLNEPALRVDMDNKLVYTDREEYQYEYLINTIPLNSFLKVANYDSTETLNYNQVLVLNLGFDKESLDNKVCWTYFPGNEIFYRVGFYNNIAGTDRLSLYVEIGYNANEHINVEDALNQTLIDLKRVGIVGSHQLVAYMPYIINPGYVYITKSSKEYVKSAALFLEQKSVYLIGRYARWEYSAMDNSLEQSKNLSETI